MKRTLLLLATIAAVLIFTAFSLTGCVLGTQSAMQDGYYTAIMSEFSHGWKEYVTICVNSGSIASVEYNAVNASGFIKTWDMAYMRNMSAYGGMYPNLYTRQYAKLLMGKQSPDGIDTISGATLSGNNFLLLSDAVIQMAMRGDDEVTVVELPKEAEQVAVVQSSEGQPTKVSSAEVQPTEVPSAEVQPTEVPSAEVQPTEVPSAEVQPTEVPSTEVQPTEVPSTEVQPTEEPTAVVQSTAVPSAEVQSSEDTDAVSSATVSSDNS